MGAVTTTGQQASQLASDRPIGLSISQILRHVAGELWDANQAAELAVISGYSAGQMQRVLVGKRRMSAEKALRLIFSGIDEGAILERYLDSYPDEQRVRAVEALAATVHRFQMRENLKRQRAELDAMESNLVRPRKSRR